MYYKLWIRFASITINLKGYLNYSLWAELIFLPVLSHSPKFAMLLSTFKGIATDDIIVSTEKFK